MLPNGNEDDLLDLMNAEERNKYLCHILGDEHAGAALTVRALNLWLTNRWLTADKKRVVVTADEHIFLYGSNLVHWVNGGGFKRWFENGQGGNLRLALAALNVLGADAEALLLREAASAVPERERAMLEVAYEWEWDRSAILSPSQEASLSELDDAFAELCNAEPNLNDRLAEFARQRRIGPNLGRKSGPDPRRGRGAKRKPKPGPKGEPKRRNSR